jgi:hypothetical protein
MALFANITAADLKNGDIIMFAMGSSSPGRVPPPIKPMFRGSICLRPDVLFDVFDHCQCHEWLLGGVCEVCFSDEKGFHIEFNIELP